MKRKDYRKPQVNIVEIPQRVYLLAGSNTEGSGGASAQDYIVNEEQDI